MRFSLMTAIALAALTVLAGLAPSPATASADSTVEAPKVSGRLVVQGSGASRQIPLKYGYATYEDRTIQRGREMTTLSRSGVTLYLSEDPLPADRQEREAFVAVRSKEGRFRGVELTLFGNVGIARAYCAGCVWNSPEMAPFWRAWFYGSYSMFQLPDKPKQMNLAIDPTRNMVTGDIQTTPGPEADGIEEIRIETTFSLPIDDTLESYSMSPVDPAIARAYADLRVAVASGKPTSVRNLVAAEYGASFDGPGAMKRVAVLQSILDRFNRVERSTALGTSVVSEADSAPGTPKQSQPPYVPERRESRLLTGVTAEFLEKWRSHVPDSLSVRFVREAGAWKLDWVLDRFGSNILASGYRTPGEHIDAIRESSRPVEDQRSEPRR